MKTLMPEAASNSVRSNIISREVHMFSEVLDLNLDEVEFFYFIEAWRVDTGNEVKDVQEMHTYKTGTNSPIIEDGDWLIFTPEFNESAQTCRLPKKLIQYIELCVRPKGSREKLIDRYKAAAKQSHEEWERNSND